ncbi:hypothetical protein [Roseibium aggregatum]|uniref:hypothetical protein n=1 Tax=Roseibium aggregatum TaxID=187304 RepID=UPI001E32FB17|nr:hypothetical protein [Roseibium aggregatum]UES49917.1 hypothetical protein GFK88_10000 [Roseibium aggregatum]
MRKLFGLLGFVFLAGIAGFGGGIAVFVIQALPTCQAKPDCIIESIVSGSAKGVPEPDIKCISESDASSIQNFISILGQGEAVNGEQFISDWKRKSESSQGCVTLKETIVGACRSIDGGLGGESLCDAEIKWQP